MELEAGQESGVVELTKTSSECKESHLPPQTVSGWGTGVGRGCAYRYPETGSIEDVHMGIQRPEAYCSGGMANSLDCHMSVTSFSSN